MSRNLCLFCRQIKLTKKGDFSFMKKLLIAAFVFITLIALAACGGNGDTQDTVNVQDDTSPTANISTELTPTPELSHTWTITELSDIIVAAGDFWEEWWEMRNRFSGEHIGTPLSQEDIPGHICTSVYGVLLPSSGFNSLNDIRSYLLNHYTQTWIDEKLSGEFAPFVEYDGVLWINAVRAGFARPNWQTATHNLIEQSGNHAVVETTVLVGAWHREDIDPMDYAWEAIHRFTLIYGRIDSPSHYELQTQQMN